MRLVPKESLEFLLRVGEPGDQSPSTEISPSKCEGRLDREAIDRASFHFTCKNPDLKVQVISNIGGTRFQKHLVVENTGRKPVVLFDVVLQQFVLAPDVRLSGGGRGWPVFLKGLGYAAIEFPESEGLISESGYSLEYYPAVTIRPGETYQTERAILELSPDPMSAFRAYVDEFKLRKSRNLFVCYSTRGAHECEGPSEGTVGEQLGHLTDLRANWHVPFEYFVVDCCRENVTEVCSDERFQKIAEDVKNAGFNLGLSLELDESASHEVLRELHSTTLKHGVKLLRLRLSRSCSDAAADKYARHQEACDTIRALEEIKAAESGIGLWLEGRGLSPWWLKYVDLLSAPEPDTADVPSPSIRDSQILKIDLTHRFFELDPGTNISYSDRHFWCGKQFWRKSLLLSLARSNQISLSGELQLLDEDDRLFLQRITHMVKAHGSGVAVPRRILGDPGNGEVYGYADTAGGRGLVAIFNPSWEAKTFNFRTEDLGCDPGVRNVCVQLFPDTEVSAIPAEGGSFPTHIDPWEVVWFEVGPSKEHCELLDSKPRHVENHRLPVTPVDPPPEIADGLTMPLERTYFKTGSTFRCRPAIPRTWEGFPLLADMRRVEGDLYVNNRPFGIRDDAEFALFYPWTPAYGTVKFGDQNLFYLATGNSEVSSQEELSLRPLSYFSSSACREDWPHPGDATMVVTVRYLLDGAPYRHSLDPRTAECAVWLDGIWMQPYRVPPLVPRIWSGFSWAVFMLDLEGDWECVRILVPKLVDCDYEVECFLTDRINAAEVARGD
jgi:hypothetical protein